jgi:predicted MPP superfamily phosphohydrolase
MAVMNEILGTAAGIATLGVAGVGYASVVERNWFALRRFTVPVLAAGASPIRVLQISDLHLVPRQRRRIEWVRGLATLAPDLVVNSGDNLAAVDAVPGALHAMEPLFDFPGVFVMGSNDVYAPVPKNPARYLTPSHADAPHARVLLPIEDLRAGMLDRGWVDLDNARTTLSVGGAEVEFVGTDDAHIKRDRYAAVAGPASATAAVTIGVTHAPYQRVLDPMAADGARLLIAGHTHGGQLALPFYGALVTNCDLPTDRAKGVSRWWPGAGSAPSSAAPSDASWLHVSAGLGTSPYAPVRFACRPEATLLTLVPADA